MNSLKSSDITVDGTIKMPLACDCDGHFDTMAWDWDCYDSLRTTKLFALKTLLLNS